MAPAPTMIVAAALVLAVFGQQKPSAGPLISRMLDRYSKAVTLQGTITTTQSARNVSVVTKTEIAMELPNKLAIRQTRNGNQGGTWYAVSDGVHFSYTHPKGALGKNNYDDRADATVQDVYTGSLRSIGEKSIPLDILIGRKEDLRAFVADLSPMELTSGVKLGSETLEVATGKYGKRGADAWLGQTAVYMTAEGDLRRMVRKEEFQVENQTIEVTTVYDVSVKLNEPIEGNPFAVS